MKRNDEDTDLAERLLEIKSTLREEDKQKQILIGRKQEQTKKLKDLGCKNRNEAKEEVKKLGTKIKSVRASLERKLNGLEEEFGIP